MPLVATLLLVLSLSSAAYIEVMFDRELSLESFMEALYFSVQTVTTVGYGNWEPVWVRDMSRTAFLTRVFRVKVISIPTMLIGAALFAAAVALATEIYRGP
jgi:hypothetical protein